jgi:SAM-dependent methyltransferase
MGDGPHRDVERWSPTQAWVYAAIAPNPRSNRLIVEHVSPGPDDVVVDIGCGAGAAVRGAARLGAQAIGVDPSPSMVRNAERRSRDVANVEFVEGHAAALPLSDDSATIVLAISTFHHWPSGEPGLIEAHRVLRSGGRLLVAERRLRSDGGHGLSGAEADDLAASMRSIGFEQVEIAQLRVRVLTLVVVSGRA